MPRRIVVNDSAVLGGFVCAVRRNIQEGSLEVNERSTTHPGTTGK
jgi:hypothetical protein